MSRIAAVAPIGIGRMAAHRLSTLIAILLSVLLLGLWVLRPTLRVAVAPDQIRPFAGQTYAAQAPTPAFPFVVNPGDNISAPRRSSLAVYENGTELGPGHAQHDRIRDVGRGAYSHWDRTVLFSSSDNTDPRTNGRRYTFETRVELSPLALWPGLVLVAAAVALTGLFDLGRLARCLRLVFRVAFPISAITSVIWGPAYIAYRQDPGRVVQNRVADSEIIYEQLRRAQESPPADLAFVGDSSCLFGIDPATIRELFPGKSVENFCTTAWVGPAGYGIQINRMLDHGTLPKTLVIYMNPVQFDRDPSWDYSTATVRSGRNGPQGRADRSPAAALDYLRQAWIERLFYHPLPGIYALYYGGLDVLIGQMRESHGSLVNAAGARFRTADEMVEFHRGWKPWAAAPRSFATTAAFDETLEDLRRPLAKLDRRNVYLLIAPVNEPLRPEALDERERRALWLAAKLGLSPDHIIRSPASLPAYLFSDGLHPTRWGRVLVTRELAKYLPSF